MKINEIFPKGVLNLSKEEYRKYGKYHYSDLSAVFLNETYKLDPKIKEDISKQISQKEVVINGNAFEKYMQDPLAYQNYYVISSLTRPIRFMGEVCDTLVNDMISPTNVEVVKKTIADLNLWKGDKTDAQKTKRAILPSNVIAYVEEQQRLRTTSIEKIIDVNTNQNIKESAIDLRAKYPILDEGVKFWEVKLELGDIAIEIDYLQVIGKTVYFYDYKFKDKQAEKWASNSYWSYGYWIQGTLYSHVVKTLLGEGFEFGGFYFIIGSNTPGDEAHIVEHPAEVTTTMLNHEIHFQGGTKIPSIKQLMDDLDWHTKHNKWSYSREIYENGYIVKPRVPLGHYSQYVKEESIE